MAQSRRSRGQAVTFECYMEYDGRRSFGYTDASEPAETISASSITEAGKLLAKKRKLNYTDYEALIDGDFRIFLSKNQFLKKPREYVFYVKVYE